MTPYFSANLSQQSAAIETLFSQFPHPDLKENLIALGALKKVEKAGDKLAVTLTFPFPFKLGENTLKTALTAPLLALTECTAVKWHIHSAIATLKRANPMPAVKGVKNIIAVTSGKGGVGKSTIAVNLALALKAIGANVGMLDADIYGPSLPLMLGAKDQRPTSPDNKHMTPIHAQGLWVNSIGFLMAEDNAMVWRGPMASSALLQMLNETLWAQNGESLDYLVIDMPPGTGDIQLTLAQQIPVTGAIIVTTPQDVALLDAMKGVQMFEKSNVPVLGIVENMALHICSNCGHAEPIFGTGGALKMAEKYQLPILSQHALHINLREDMDAGTPTVTHRPTSAQAQAFLTLAQRVAAELYWQGSVIPDEILFTEIK